jgi:hypothetical protein
MTSSDVGTAPALGIDWKAAIWAGLVAGAIFMVFEMAAVAMTGESAWGPPRMMAAIVLGKGVLPPPASFDMTIMMVAMAVHLMFSVLLGFLVAVGFVLARRRPSPGVGALIGGTFGLLLYIVNFYGFTAVFPWFAMARNLISIVGHIMFGVILVWTYLKLARPRLV